jgi:hypothetical protein
MREIGGCPGPRLPHDGKGGGPSLTDGRRRPAVTCWRWAWVDGVAAHHTGDVSA